jgi:hypothetical protein
MENPVVEYLIANKEWIFSGVGVAVISWILFRKSASSTMNQKGGDNSTNIQVGLDFKNSNKDKNSGDK